jgi:signal transduction histidine kinase
MRDHVLSLVSHDLRGPLNAIHSWAYVLERKIVDADPTAQRALTGIRTGVEQQVTLLENVVDATRAETRTLTLDREPVVLRRLIDGAVDEVCAAFAQARGVSIDVGSALSGEEASGDPAHLAGALWLMLTFAVEASTNGSAVTLASAVDGASWHTVVTFCATPAALEDTALPHLLEAFARKQAREPGEAGRIAWVLALCKRVAEAHGGTFEQKQTEDAPIATLTLRIPLVAAASIS